MKLIKLYCCLLLLLGQIQSFADTNNRRIIGGRDAENDAWPWMVSINNRSGVHCGGSLIAPYWVMTAAHCFDNEPNPSQDLSLYLNFTDQQLLDNAEKRRIAAVFVHPQWDTYNYDSPYDIALVRLNEASAQKPVYADIGVDSHAKANLFATALGWGTTRTNTFISSRYLQQVTLPLVSLAICQNAYHGTYTLFEGQLCAGLEIGGKDGCAGDSGAPLVVHDGTDWRVLGISSFGGTSSTPCGGAGLYGIYSHVHYYKDFMRPYLYQDLALLHNPQIKTGEIFDLNLQERRNVPRTAVDLWVALEQLDNNKLYFFTGSPNMPTLHNNPLVWREQIDAEQREQQILSVKIPAGMTGSYRLYAVYIDTGQPLDLRYQRSEVAVSAVKITP